MSEHKRILMRCWLPGSVPRNWFNKFWHLVGKPSRMQQPLDLQLLVKEVCKFLRATFPATIDIRQHFTEATSIILGDPIQMHQVLMNLCANAEYAMRGNGGLLELKLEHVTGEPDGIGAHPDLQGECLCMPDCSRYWIGYDSGCCPTHL